MAPTLGSMLAAIGAVSEWGAVSVSLLMWDNTNGRIGLGVTTPREKLHISGGGISLSGSGNGSSYHWKIKDAADQSYLGIGYFDVGGNVWYPSGSATVPAIRINYTGQVSIGSNPSASYSLVTNLPIYVPGSSIFCQNNNSETTYTYAPIQIREAVVGGSVSYLAPRLAFHWGGVVASQISVDSTGRIVILTGEGTSYESFLALNIYSTGDIYLGNRSTWLSTYLNQAVQTTSSPTFNQTYLTGVGNSASLFYVSSIITGSLYLLIQHGSGQIGVTYFNSSSKEKKNIRSIEIDSFLLHQLNYKSFEMKNDKTERKQFGLIAEEVHEICPDLVAYEEDGITPFFVRYDMVGVLAAMETTKQQKIIDDLLKRIEKLEKKNG
jgi:hypothetical protein